MQVKTLFLLNGPVWYLSHKGQVTLLTYMHNLEQMHIFCVTLYLCLYFMYLNVEGTYETGHI